MIDDAFSSFPGPRASDEAIVRRLARAADVSAPASLRASAADAVGRELRRVRMESTWAFAAWLLIAAVVWMQVSAVLPLGSEYAQAVSVRGIADRTSPNSLDLSIRAWSRVFLPLD